MNQGIGILTGIWTCGKCPSTFTDEAECAEHEGFCEGRTEEGHKFNCDYCQDTGYVPYPYFEPPWVYEDGKPYNGRSWRCFKCNFQPLPDPFDNKEREVKDKYEYRSQCTFCKTWTNTEYPQYLNYVCQDCEKKLRPTLSVELTEEEIERLYNIIGESYTSKPFDPCSESGKNWMAFHDTLIAKLRPKKESVEEGFVEFWVDERFKARIYSDVVGLYERCESQIGEKDATFMYKQIPRSTFEKLYAQYEERVGVAHDHVDKVK